MSLSTIMTYSFVDNTVYEYMVALGVFVLSLVILYIFKTFFIKKLEQIAKNTATDIDDLVVALLNNISWPFYTLISLYVTLQFIDVPEFATKTVNYALLVVVTFHVVKGLHNIIDYSTHKLILKKEQEDKSFDGSTMDLLKNVLKIILWVFAVIILLQNFGYNISALVAGLGIGGVAFAFALQSILGDMLASVSIYLDKPFQVGDFIIVGTDMGTVQKIGIKSTRIKTLQGEELVMSNKELTEVRVRNYKRMQRRRILFSFGVVYETPLEKMKEIPQIVKKIIDDIEITDFDRAHFKEFAESSLNFEVVYFIKNSDYNIYMDTHQDINLQIMAAFKEKGISMAYPTRTLYMRAAALA